jgi:hypothetical protein
MKRESPHPTPGVRRKKAEKPFHFQSASKQQNIKITKHKNIKKHPKQNKKVRARTITGVPLLYNENTVSCNTPELRMD